MSDGLYSEKRDSLQGSMTASCHIIIYSMHKYKDFNLNVDIHISQQLIRYIIGVNHIDIPGN